MLWGLVGRLPSDEKLWAAAVAVSLAVTSPIKTSLLPVPRLPDTDDEAKEQGRCLDCLASVAGTMSDDSPRSAPSSPVSREAPD